MDLKLDISTISSIWLTRRRFLRLMSLQLGRPTHSCIRSSDICQVSIVWSSVFVLAETSVRSPRTLPIYTHVNNDMLWIRVSQRELIWFQNKSLAWSTRCRQCFCFGRNIGKVTPNNVYIAFKNIIYCLKVAKHSNKKMCNFEGKITLSAVVHRPPLSC